MRMRSGCWGGRAGASGRAAPTGPLRAGRPEREPEKEQRLVSRQSCLKTCRPLGPGRGRPARRRRRTRGMLNGVGRGFLAWGVASWRGWWLLRTRWRLNERPGGDPGRPKRKMRNRRAASSLRRAATRNQKGERPAASASPSGRAFEKHRAPERPEL